MWIALFSRSGSEIEALCSYDHIPDLIISDRELEDRSLSRDQYIVMSHDDIMKFLLTQKKALITLHGYLRILPSSVTLECNVYNGHPGDIILYPELKGINPQKKAFDLGYTPVGCVIHEVIPEVDEGRVVKYESKKVVDYSLEGYYNQLSNMQLKLWRDFFERSNSTNSL